MATPTMGRGLVRSQHHFIRSADVINRLSVSPLRTVKVASQTQTPPLVSFRRQIKRLKLVTDSGLPSRIMPVSQLIVSAPGGIAALLSYEATVQAN